MQKQTGIWGGTLGPSVVGLSSLFGYDAEGFSGAALGVDADIVIFAI